MRRLYRLANRLLDEGHDSEVAASWFHFGVGLAYAVMLAWHLNAAVRHRRDARRLERRF